MNPHVKAALWLAATTLTAGATIAQSVDWAVVGPNDLAKIICGSLITLGTNAAGLWAMLGTKPPEKPNA